MPCGSGLESLRNSEPHGNCPLHNAEPLQFPQRRLSSVFLKDRLAGARAYRRVAGYFRSVFELVEEEIDGIDSIEIVDPRDIQASRIARETALKEKWSEERRRHGAHKGNRAQAACGLPKDSISRRH